MNLVEETVKIDKQGRLVLPAVIREKTGLKGGGKVSIRLDGPRVIIEPILENLEENVKRWKESTLRLHADPFTEEIHESWKWIDREYARRKLGIG